VPTPTSDELTVASFNMERFFDTVNDPSTGDPVLTAAAYDRRLNKASLIVRTVEKLPDVIGVEEMENLTTLQDVAARINSDALAATGTNPQYQAYLVEGNDIGGIDVGFLVKSTRVTVVDVTQFGKDTTYVEPAGGSALLNDRPPLLLRATIVRPTGGTFAFTVIVNHLRSLSGIDDPADGDRVRQKRRAQAEFLANLIQARQVADPNENIITVGDMNAFQVNDATWM
jgi:predicted extracellular nuclease